MYDPKISDKMNITIIDNYVALKLPRLNEKIIHDRLATTYRKNQLGWSYIIRNANVVNTFSNKDKNVGSTGDI